MCQQETKGHKVAKPATKVHEGVEKYVYRKGQQDCP